MEYWVYYKDGKELMPFIDWVNEHGSAKDKKVHDTSSEDNSPNKEFSSLLDKYLKELGATHTRQFEDGEPVTDFEPINL